MIRTWYNMFISQVLRGVALLSLRVTCVFLPVDYSRLKTDDTSVFKNHLLPPPLLAHSSLAPSGKPHIDNLRERQYELRLSLAKHRHLCHTSSVDHPLQLAYLFSRITLSLDYCLLSRASLLFRQVWGLTIPWYVIRSTVHFPSRCFIRHIYLILLQYYDKYYLNYVCVLLSPSFAHIHRLFSTMPLLMA